MKAERQMSGEMRIARGALGWGAVASVPAAGLAWLLRGPDGAASVAIAFAMVLANAGIAASLSALAGRISTIAAAMVSLPSFALRMAAMFGALAWLKQQSFIDGPAFALAFGASATFVLYLESVRWKRTPWIAMTLKEKA